ncbi:MAG: RNA polymerase sigma factor [Balneolaceae bacterium]|nr:RNA polymerase sigma factor [Balneolaceae bacterium]
MNSDEQKKSEFELIDQILRGSRDRYKVLVDRYAPVVFHVVRRFEKDEDEVEELAQQIFVKAYEKLENFNKNSAFSSWLYSIAMNHCRDYAKNIRRQKKRFSEFEPGYLDTIFTEEKTPFMHLEMKEWKELLKKALDGLSAEYSEPFLFKYRDGMSYEVMSQQTGVSVSALKVRVHRARKELKYRLKKEVQ